MGAVVLSLLVLGTGCGDRGSPFVVIYTSQDQVYSQPILRELEEVSGVAIRTVFDSEAVKTVGLANRLMAERQNPQCDIWWSNEEMRTRQLLAKGVLSRDTSVERLGYRTRRLVINTNLLSFDEAPRRFQDLTNGVWKGQVALAYPQFGTTATHFHFLRQYWGEEAWKQWCRALVDNEPMLLSGNSTVVRLVGAGEVAIGMTDWDDIAAGQRDGLPVAELPLPEDSIIIFSTAALVHRAPRLPMAQYILEQLEQSETVAGMVGSALEGVGIPEGLMPIEDAVWRSMINDLEVTTSQLGDLFLR